MNWFLLQELAKEDSVDISSGTSVSVTKGIVFCRWLIAAIEDQGSTMWILSAEILQMGKIE